ncbi:biotin--[acetyl-CoA-carboxylase] ligase [Variovorax sp. dw_308]|uniref:biotin--[acetyl-CoA-carboxylase] ligase n=1 Tax=Variovorax sp. dw_308 TaxID=2721546 RepID=UPI001C43A7E1|nr:biotin--[acetyl-CoA-carboxylase] ligase [Variovorax sp. dw_308]
MTPAWPVTELHAALGALVAGMTVEWVPEIDSTNTELMRRARAGDAAPVLLVAERQTAGRGRLGRPWQSASDAGPGTLDESLTFSLGLPLAPADWSGLSLAVGASVADSLDPEGAQIRLKWPNDLWTAQDRKLGGILIETAMPHGGEAQRFVVIGIGLNIGPRPAEGLNTAPAWLREFRADATAPQALAAIAAPLVRDVLRFAAQGFAPFTQAFAARDALHGRELSLSDGTIGACEGVGAGGELLVRTSAGLQSITSSEVSVRPKAGEVRG